MKVTDQTKSISYVKAHAAEIIKKLNEGGEPIIVTQNGEAKAVIVDVGEYEKTLETMALMKILAMGKRDVEKGRFSPAEDVIKRLRERRKSR